MLSESLRREQLLEEVLREFLSAGAIPSISEIEDRYEKKLALVDPEKPIFAGKQAEGETSHWFELKEDEISSASKTNKSLSSISSDLSVLYKGLFNITNKMLGYSDRWRKEVAFLESRLDRQIDRIKSLLILTQDTEGYFSFVEDNFADLSKTDLAYTDADVDTGTHTVTLKAELATELAPLNITSNNIVSAKFNLLNKSKVLAGSAEKTSLAGILENIPWIYRVQTSEGGQPISAEMIFEFSEALEFNKIALQLHMSSVTVPVVITPLYSVDGFNYSQLPSTQTAVTTTDSAVFIFEAVKAKFVKFVLLKESHDLVDKSVYMYDFGFKNLRFFNRSFEEDSEDNLVSKIYTIKDSAGNSKKFNKLSLEACEDVPGWSEGDTDIKYYLAAGNNPNAIVDGSTIWHSIAPKNSSRQLVDPVIIEVGNTTSAKVTGVGISFTGIPTLANPADSFTLLSLSGGEITSTSTTSASRYTFTSPENMILDHELNSSMEYLQNSLKLFRNSGVRDGLTSNENLTVRDIVNGWGFSDPYYSTIVNIEPETGLHIDFGRKFVIIDEQQVNGERTIAKGLHRVLVHKDSFSIVSPGKTEEILKSDDSLYPYNHKLLIEGYRGSSVYKGVSLFAEYLMKKVGIFEFLNTDSDDYTKYAIDRDASGREVVLIKVKQSLADFLNEKFTLYFQAINATFTDIRFKATLKTSKAGISPTLTGYRIKIG